MMICVAGIAARSANTIASTLVEEQECIRQTTMYAAVCLVYAEHGSHVQA